PIANNLHPQLQIDQQLHMPLAFEMMTQLCGDEQEKWQETLKVAKDSINARIKMWDCITEIMRKNPKENGRQTT
ncbi:MAG: DUF3050 domain-containing protein, partial [Hymenobacteraceae bacterium]|nr:DUF3050 domain-containing protein [Hymenobacteraceae bacterium]MDX5394821.1 DUF3050 domain-containing protein [Hymenobacteraceae bacterium]MDX5443120.1 DUF3050 domain-containing protein [Hymenobacteraceae bacterium]MDX5510855.1 DUF3050 domain-containing protein [Hymenobacteraceae bacterium]